MRFAVNIPPFTDPRAIVDLGVLAEQAGWDAVLLWDHVQWDTHLELDVRWRFGPSACCSGRV